MVHSELFPCLRWMQSPQWYSQHSFLYMRCCKNFCIFPLVSSFKGGLAFAESIWSIEAIPVSQFHLIAFRTAAFHQFYGGNIATLCHLDRFRLGTAKLESEKCPCVRLLNENVPVYLLNALFVHSTAVNGIIMIGCHALKRLLFFCVYLSSTRVALPFLISFSLLLFFFLSALFRVSSRLQSTPLHLAAGYNRVRIVQLLLQHGADVHAKDKGYVHVNKKEKRESLLKLSNFKFHQNFPSFLHHLVHCFKLFPQLCSTATSQSC